MFIQMNCFAVVIKYKINEHMLIYINGLILNNWYYNWPIFLLNGTHCTAGRAFIPYLEFESNLVPQNF